MRAWGITDGKAGNVAQVKALALAMGVDTEMHDVSVRLPWKFLPNMAFDLGMHKIFPVTRHKFPTTTPDLIISCGRKGALVSASLKTQANRVHIQDPQMRKQRFDVVIAMEHDALFGSNVLRTPFALHSINPEALTRASRQWEPKFAHLPKPWNAVLIGGSTNKYNFGKEAMAALLSRIDDIEGSLLITNSRRTGDANTKLLQDYFLHSRRVFMYGGALENPYMGMLACADHIYVTNDSVNMMSEAYATAKPVTILPLAGHANTKPARFAESIKSIAVNPREMMAELAKSVREMLVKRT